LREKERKRERWRVLLVQGEATIKTEHGKLNLKSSLDPPDPCKKEKEEKEERKKVKTW